MDLCNGHGMRLPTFLDQVKYIRHFLQQIFLLENIFPVTPEQSGRGENYSRYSFVGNKDRGPNYSPVYNKYLTAGSWNQRYQERLREPTSSLYSSPLSRNRSVIIEIFSSNFFQSRLQKDQISSTKSISNFDFPFKKYKSDFTPFAPYKNVHESGEHKICVQEIH